MQKASRPGKFFGSSTVWAALELENGRAWFGPRIGVGCLQINACNGNSPRWSYLSQLSYRSCCVRVSAGRLVSAPQGKTLARGNAGAPASARPRTWRSKTSRTKKTNRTGVVWSANQRRFSVIKVRNGSGTWVRQGKAFARKSGVAAVKAVGKYRIRAKKMAPAPGFEPGTKWLTVFSAFDRINLKRRSVSIKM